MIFSKKNRNNNRNLFTGKTECGTEYGKQSFRFYPVYSGKHFYLDFTEKRIQNIPGDLASLAEYLSGWKTIPDIIEETINKTGYDDRIEISESIKELTGKGILISKSDFKRKIKKPDNLSECRITSFVCCTKERPEPLKNCIESYRSNFSRYKGDVRRIIILDDSVSADSVNKNMNITGIKPERKTGPDLIYVGNREKAEFKKVLSGKSRDIPDQVLDFAFKGELGANRNISLLFTAGENIISADDDTAPLFSDPPEAEQEMIELTSSFEPVIFKMMQSMQELSDEVSFSDKDIAQLYKGFLGKDAASLISSLNQDFLLMKDCSGDFAVHLIKHGGRIRLASTGITGDCAMSSLKGYLLCRSTSRNTLMSGRGYSENRHSRYLHFLSPVTSLTRSNHFMAAQFALENSHLVPPFFSFFRNSDGVFAHMLTALDNEALICHLPFSVYHNPPETRSEWKNFNCEWKPRASELLTLFIKTFYPPPGPGCPEERMIAMGKHFCELSELPVTDFYRYISKTMLPSIALYLDSHYRIVEDYNGMPSEWASDISNFINHIEENISRPEFYVPEELCGVLNTEEAGLRFKQLLYSYGELLQWWPFIWNRAKEINIKE